MDKDTVNIIIPIYNVERYLRKCLNSVRKQTYKNIEVILVDDGSPDKCPQICDEYASKDRRFKVIHQSNGGVSSARNVGLEYAINYRGGEHIMFVDPDDWLPKDAVEVLVRKQESTGADWVLGGFITVYNARNGKDTLSENLFAKEDKKQFQKFGLMADVYRIHNTPGKIYRKNIIAENSLRFNEEIKLSEDSLFNYQYIQRCRKFATVKKNVYYYNCLEHVSAIRKYFPERNVWKKTVLQERQKCFGEILEEDVLLGYNNYVLAVFNKQLIRRYVDALPKEEAIAKIYETYELFKELLDKIALTDNIRNNDSKYGAIKIYLEYEPWLKAGQYEKVYDYFYANAAASNGLKRKIKSVGGNILGRVRTFILFGW